MRKIVLKISMSVDGFVATASGGLEWMFPSMSEDATDWIVQTLWQAGTHIMGRATYLGMAGHWPSSAEVFAAPMNQIPKVVFSKSLGKADWGESQVVSGDLGEEIARLRQ